MGRFSGRFGPLNSDIFRNKQINSSLKTAPAIPGGAFLCRKIASFVPDFLFPVIPVEKMLSPVRFFSNPSRIDCDMLAAGNWDRGNPLSEGNAAAREAILPTI